MKAQGLFNHWRAEANRLPAPTLEGERCISPGGVPFQVGRALDEHQQTVLWWELCGPGWTPSGICFRERTL